MLDISKRPSRGWIKKLFFGGWKVITGKEQGAPVNCKIRLLLPDDRTAFIQHVIYLKTTHAKDELVADMTLSLDEALAPFLETVQARVKERRAILAEMNIRIRPKPRPSPPKSKAVRKKQPTVTKPKVTNQRKGIPVRQERPIDPTKKQPVVTPTDAGREGYEEVPRAMLSPWDLEMIAAKAKEKQEAGKAKPSEERAVAQAPIDRVYLPPPMERPNAHRMATNIAREQRKR